MKIIKIEIGNIIESSRWITETKKETTKHVVIRVTKTLAFTDTMKFRRVCDVCDECTPSVMPSPIPAFQRTNYRLIIK